MTCFPQHITGILHAIICSSCRLVYGYHGQTNFRWSNALADSTITILGCNHEAKVHKWLPELLCCYVSSFCLKEEIMCFPNMTLTSLPPSPPYKILHPIRCAHRGAHTPELAGCRQVGSAAAELLPCWLPARCSLPDVPAETIWLCWINAFLTLICCVL